MNLPNSLTISRFFLTILFIAFITGSSLMAKVLGAFMYALAALSDVLDGYFARKLNLVTDLGKIMDPIADKFLTLSAFCVFSLLKIIPFWMFVIILIREFLVTAVRLYAIKRQKILAAESLGKLKTVFQMVTTFVILFFIILSKTALSSGWTDNILSVWKWVITILMFCVVAITVYSGGAFLRNNWRFYRV